MYQLTLTIDGEEDVFQSASQQTLIREVVDVFRSKNSDLYPLPFTCEVNQRGQIVTLTLENKPNEPYWIEFHPVNGRQVQVKAVIRKEAVEQAKECFDIPSDLLNGDGNCWVAIKKGAVVDLVYMRLGKDEDFTSHREKALSRLKPQGTIIDGLITAKKFFPKASRKNSERG
jgi:hypothetical protein